MKIALIELGSFNGELMPDVTMGWHNHGLAILATLLKEKSVEFDYINLKELPHIEALVDILCKGYSTVAISMMSSDYKQATELISFIKSYYPATRIIVGGIGATVNPTSLVDNEDIDFIIQGEGEWSFLELIRDGFAANHKIIKGVTVKDLNILPFIDRGIFKNPLERNVDGWGQSPMATIITARGCPYKCTFCQPAESIHFGKKLRRRSVDNVMAEIHELMFKYHPKFFVFYDDSFAYDKKWTKEFIDKYDCAAPFLASARADFICNNEDLVLGLKDVGLKVMSVGFESGSDRILQMIKKGTTVTQNLEAARILGDNGIRIFANIMYGFPTENKEEQQQTRYMCEYIKQFDSMISPAYFTPFPGTELGDKCSADGTSLVDENSMTRFGRDKIKGIDYDFLDSFVWS